jgi:peptidoglycan/xylan/chitin deacetylase (PgdA/CDA1 family)
MGEGKSYCLLTNDVETTSIYFNMLRPETGYKVWREGMPLLLDLYAKYNIRSTFFFCIDIVKLYPDVVKMVIPYGHEIASHGYSHKISETFGTMTYEKQLQHLILSKKILEDISGQEVISFRAPALRINRFTPQALAEAGYKIDSSVPSQRFDFFLSFGSVNKLKWILAPRKPYRTNHKDLTKKGVGAIIEIPLSATGFPYIGTTLRLMPHITKIQRYLLHIETGFTKKPLVFDIHPNEFIDEACSPRIIERRTSNLIMYLFADLIRSQLKIKNLGPQTLPLYAGMINFYSSKQYCFETIKDYTSKLNV